MTTKRYISYISLGSPRGGELGTMGGSVEGTLNAKRYISYSSLGSPGGGKLGTIGRIV